MNGIKTIGLIRNPSNRNFISENPTIQVQPNLTFAGQIEITGAIVEEQIVGEGENQTVNTLSKVGFTINDISAEDLADIQEHYDAIITKCKTIVADRFKASNPDATFIY